MASISSCQTRNAPDSEIGISSTIRVTAIQRCTILGQKRAGLDDGTGSLSITTAAAGASARRSPMIQPSCAASELRDRHDAESARLAGRDVVVAVRRRPVALIKDVLDVELHAPVLVDLAVDRGVDA